MLDHLAVLSWSLFGIGKLEDAGWQVPAKEGFLRLRFTYLEDMDGTL
jgi:hypothetical protein